MSASLLMDDTNNPPPPPQQPSTSSKESRPLEALFALSKLWYWRVFIVLVWIGVAALGATRSGSLFDNLQDELDPKSSSPSMVAKAVFNDANLCYANDLGNVMITANAASESVLDVPGVEEAVTQDFGDVTATFYDLHANDTSNSNPLAAPVFLSSDNRSTVIWLSYAFGSLDDVMFQVTASLQDAAVTVSGSSHTLLDHSNSGGATSDLKKMDSVAIPLALVVLGVRLRSVTMLLIPILMLLITLLSAFALLQNIQANGTHFPSFAPSLFVSSAIAMNFDWSLFVLTRYREALLSGLSNADAVHETVVRVLPAVVMSGSCLILSFLSLVLLPSKFISHTGIGACLTILMALLVNISLLPPLLLSCGRVWSFGLRSNCCRCRQRGDTDDDDAATTALLSSLNEDSDGKPSLTAREKRSIWYGVVTTVVRYPWRVLLIVALAGIPFFVFIARFSTTIDQNQIHPRNTDLYNDWRTYIDVFANGPVGILAFPYVIIAKPLIDTHGEPPTPSQAAAVVNEHNALIEHLVHTMNVPATTFSGPTWVNGVGLDADTAVSYLNSSDIQTPEACLSRYRNLNPIGIGCPGVNQIMCAHVNDDFTVFYTEFDPPCDPQGSGTGKLIENLRQAAEQFTTPGVVEFMIAFGLSEMYDVKHEVVSLLPIAVLATLGILLLLVCAYYRSIPMAVRLVITIGLNLSIVGGLAMIIFPGGVYWMAPTLTLSLVIGLAADYDFFLTSRIREVVVHRNIDSNEASIVYGYTKTGDVITTAGIIMVISFGVLMLSSQLLLVQAGFFLAFSVLLDTFVIRSLVVPAMMMVCGKWNWWPAVKNLKP